MYSGGNRGQPGPSPKRTAEAVPRLRAPGSVGRPDYGIFQERQHRPRGAENAPWDSEVSHAIPQGSLSHCHVRAAGGLQTIHEIGKAGGDDDGASPHYWLAADHEERPAARAWSPEL